MPPVIGAAILAGLGADAVAVGAGTLATSTILGVSTASIVGYAAIAAGVIGAEAVIDATAAQSKHTFTSNQVLSPRVRIYGRTMVGGVRAFMQVRSGNLYQVIMLASDHIDGIEQYYIGDVGVALISGLVQSAPWGRSGGASYIGIEVLAGAPGQAQSGIILNAFPELGPSFRLDGIAYAAIVMVGAKDADFPTIYPAQFATQFRFVARGARIYDPRQAGQNAADKATWTWSQTAGLCILDYLTHADGLGLPPSTIDLPSFAAKADIDDQPVPLKAGGTEPRYQINGVYTFDEPPKTVLARMEACCDGQLVQGPSGRIGIRGGAWANPTVSIGSNFVTACDFQVGAGALAAYNQLVTSFAYGYAYWQMTEIAPRDDLVSQAAEGQIRQTLALPMVTSFTQAARLGKIKMLKDNPAFVGTARTLAPGLDAISEQVINFEFAPGFSSVPLVSGSFAVTSHGFAGDLSSVDLSLSSLDAGAYAWDPATEEPDPPKTPQQISDPNIIDPPANTHAAIAMVAQALVGTLTWDASSRLDVAPVAQFSLAGQAMWQPMTLGSNGLSATTPALQRGSSYDFEVAFAGGGASSTESLVANILAKS